MIDPANITNFDRTEIELQEFFLFCACVTGKTAVVQARKLEHFLQPAWFRAMTPFEYIDELVNKGKLEIMIAEAKLGQYKRLAEVFKRATAFDDLETVTLTQMQCIPGIGPKTSRFFAMHSRPNQRYAVLDTHILTWLRENTHGVTVPQSTPQSSNRYDILESLFLKECDRRCISPEVLDLAIWNERSRKIA